MPRTKKPTPDEWKGTISTSEVEVLPLAADPDGPYSSGWVSYGHTLTGSPQIEVLAGGINSKMSEGAALWRQGNLLHFGFDLSPDEMNDSGRALLVNSIAYIAKFTEDRVIVRAPSCFVGGRFVPRERIHHWLGLENDPFATLERFIDPPLVASLEGKEREACMQWFQGVRESLRPGPGGLLVIDENIKALGFRYDEPAFFEKAIACLGRPALEKHAREVLARYAPEGPDRAASAAAWEEWLRGHRPYLFFTEWGGYRWYVDSLAKKRGVPTADLRGPARADERPHGVRQAEAAGSGPARR